MDHSHLLWIHRGFLTFHTLLVLFNLTGWIFPLTRRLHLLSIFATAFSWFVLGIWYGFGYCFLTEWHWEVLHRMGRTDLPRSYMKFLLDSLTGRNWNAFGVDLLTVLLFFAAAILSLYWNGRDLLSRRAKKDGGSS